MATDDRTEVYAEAIAGIARGENALDAVDDELTAVARAVRGDRDLYEALTDASLPVGRRLEVVDRILQAAHPATRTSVSLLVTAGRAKDLEDVAARVAELAAGARDRAVAEVTVAVPLAQEQREQLRRALERSTGKQLELKVLVDPSIVGGVRAKIGDTVIDGTVARRLDEIRARLGAGSGSRLG